MSRPNWAVHADFRQFEQSANYTIKTGFLRESDKTSVVYVLFWVYEGVCGCFGGLKYALSLMRP